MSILLSSSFEIKPWTEEAIRLILKNKKVQGIKEKLKEFASKFLKHTYSDTIQHGNIELAEDLITSLREISNPYNYFA